MKRKQTINHIICSLCLLSLFGSGCSTIRQYLPGRETAPDEAEQITIPVVKGSIGSTISFVGNVQYSQSAVLNWKTDGVIGKVLVKTGDQVKKDDILAELETDSLNSSVLYAEKSMYDSAERLEDVQESSANAMNAYLVLSQKEAALKKAKLDQEALYYPRATQLELELAWDKYALANMNFNYAREDYRVMMDSYQPWEYTGGKMEIGRGRGRFGFFMPKIINGDEGVSARERKFEEYTSAYNTLVESYEDFTWKNSEPSATDYAVAEGNVRKAQMEYDKALEDYLTYQNGPKETEVMAAQNQLRSAETTYNKRYIIAQFDGTVTSVSAVEGYYVKNGATALRLDDMSRMFVPISISELDLRKLNVGQRAEITLDSLPGKTFSGKIYSIDDSSTASQMSTAFGAMVEFDSPDPEIHAGMTAEVSIPLEQKEGVLLVPNSALIYGDDGVFVTVKSGDTTKQVAVQLGAVDENVSEAVRGVKAGDKLVADNITFDELERLGLDPAEYMPEMSGMPRDGQMPQGFGRPESRPEVQPTTVPTDIPKAEPKEVLPAEPTEAPTEEPPVPEEADKEHDPFEKGETPPDFPEGMPGRPPQMPEGMEGMTPPEGGWPERPQGAPPQGGPGRPGGQEGGPWGPRPQQTTGETGKN